ncbi:FusB/FusC family EF-G-binding protein [Brevibacillus migulae]|uniref:FusB/FusC family EF-G-binding protein n=1 Tax=Brevibacillus migulae TaxID=1644114 RepID=UPI00106E6D7C|nr:FusB/FusC family EF-G-binding protein [Brevibacillus migulae]
MGPFIRNHEYNFIKKQAGILHQACRTVSDRSVLESVRNSAVFKIMELFPEASGAHKQLLEQLYACKETEDFHRYLRSLEPYLCEFPQITDQQIKKLFPKNKKLKIPDLSAIDYRFVTYLSWMDVSTNKLFMVYPKEGQVIGIEGKFTLANKKSYCFLCNKTGEVGLFTAITKSRPAHSSPDYYKAIGNYMCMNGQECNQNITDYKKLEDFLANVLGKQM